MLIPEASIAFVSLRFLRALPDDMLVVCGLMGLIDFSILSHFPSVLATTWTSTHNVQEITSNKPKKKKKTFTAKKKKDPETTGKGVNWWK